MKPIRPAFWVDVKVRIDKNDGTSVIDWLRIDELFDGSNVECALAHAVDKAGEEVRRIANRPAYKNLKERLGGTYHVVNVRFVRVDVENEDGERGPAPDSRV